MRARAPSRLVLRTTRGGAPGMRRSADHGNFAQEWPSERWHAGERRGTNGVEFRIDRSTPMDAATSLDDTVRKAQDILWDALPPVTRGRCRARDLARQLPGVCAAREPAYARRYLGMAGQDAVGVVDHFGRSGAECSTGDSARHDPERATAELSLALSEPKAHAKRVWQLLQALVSLAVANHLQTVVVQPPAAETHLTASRWKRPAADRTTLNLGAVAARFGAGLSARTLRKRADLRHCGLCDESGEQQQRHTVASHMTRQRRFGVTASVFGVSGTIEGAAISRSR